jgi:hypothetical protein
MCSRHHWLFTAGAVFLLLFTAVDLAYPSMCGEDGHGSTFGAPQSSLSIGATPESSDSSPAHADDCFCCCGHVIAGALFHIAIPSAFQQSHFNLTAHRVAIAAPATFRPPRIA